MNALVRLSFDKKTWWKRVGMWWVPLFATIRNRRQQNPQQGICNKEFVYENFCGLPKGHVGPCDNPPNMAFADKIQEPPIEDRILAISEYLGIKFVQKSEQPAKVVAVSTKTGAVTPKKKSAKKS